MSDLKPIEPGSLCMVTKGQHTGEHLTALRFVGHPSQVRTRDGNYWEVDKNLGFEDEYGRDIKGGYPYARESWLMRIDGHNEQEVTKELELTQ